MSSSDEDSFRRVNPKRVTIAVETTETDSLLESFRPGNSKRVIIADEATELDDLLPNPSADGTSLSMFYVCVFVH
jgi:hypothetical protein